MQVTGLCCTRCKSTDVLAIWPGNDREDVDLLPFPLLPGRPVQAWCERCWLERFGTEARLPRRSNRVNTSPERAR